MCNKIWTSSTGYRILYSRGNGSSKNFCMALVWLQKPYVLYLKNCEWMRQKKDRGYLNKTSWTIKIALIIQTIQIIWPKDTSNTDS